MHYNGNKFNWKKKCKESFFKNQQALAAVATLKVQVTMMVCLPKLT